MDQRQRPKNTNLKYLQISDTLLVNNIKIVFFVNELLLWSDISCYICIITLVT